MTWPTYHSVNVDGLDVFYREAGNSAAPTLLLLHGFPTSSHMIRDLIPMLSDRFHVHHTTVQFEHMSCAISDTGCSIPVDAGHGHVHHHAH